MAGQGLTPNWMLLARTQQLRLPMQRRATSLRAVAQRRRGRVGLQALACTVRTSRTV